MLAWDRTTRSLQQFATLRRATRVSRAIVGVAWETARGRTAQLVAVAAALGLLGAVTGLFTKLVVDAVADGDGGRAFATGALYLALVGLSPLLDSASGLLQSELGERTSQAMEQKLMGIAAAAPGLEHLEHPEFADKVKLVRDRAFIPYFAFSNLSSLAGVAFGLVSAVVLLTWVHPALVLLPAVAVPGVALQYRAYRRHFSRYDRTAVEERLAEHYLELATTPPAAKEVRLFGLGPTLIDRHAAVTGGYIAKLFRDQLLRTRTAVAAGGLYGAAMAGAIGFVGWLALAGRASVGDVALAVQVTGMTVGQAQAAARQAAWIAELAFTGERYLWLLDYRPSVVVKPPGEALPAPAAIRDGITVEGVTFVYPGTTEPVLRDVSLHLPAGSTVALVGENGAGKTSLVKLLCRFYDPTEGRILVDGVDLRDLDLAGWRERAGVAFQDFVRFQLLAREAVGVGDLPALDDLGRVGTSARQAGADRVIERLPSGYDTQLGRWFEGGVDLSEGEWQRVALARGLMRPFPLVLVLDEPTASLDPRAEHEVFERFAAMAAGADGRRPVTLLVSHRFSTVRMADLIVVLHQGRVEEVGSHEELLAAGARYAELFRLQASRY
jgi:ATP-binding cassette subfamily B protein